MATLPLTTDHLRRDLKMTKDGNFVAYILDTTTAINDVGDGGPLDQCVWHLPSYSSKSSLERSEAYVYRFEVWGQAGSRETPMHVDHGRTIAFLPPCLDRALRFVFVSEGIKWTPNSRVKSRPQYLQDDSRSRILRRSSTPWWYCVRQQPSLSQCNTRIQGRD